MNLPYLILPLCIGYREGTEERVVDGRFIPNLITAYHEGYYPDTGMFIYHDHQPFQIRMSIEDFENVLRGYWDNLGKKQSIKDKLRIIN